MEQNNDVQNMNTPNEVTQSSGSLNEQTQNNSEPKSPKFNMLFIILLIVAVLGLAGYIVYDKVLGGNINLSFGSSKGPSSEPLNETFETSEECALKTDELISETGLYFKPAKELSLNKTSLIKSSYSLSQTYYCLDMDCSDKESDLLDNYRELVSDGSIEGDIDKTSGFSDLAVSISNGVVTLTYPIDMDDMKKTTIKLDLTGVKGVGAATDCAGEPYVIFALDGKNDLYMYKIIMDDDSKNSLSKKILIYKNVKDFKYDAYENDIFTENESCGWDQVAFHTLDGKSFLANIGRDTYVNVVDLSKVNQLTISSDTGIGLGTSIFIVSSNDYTYQKYNGKDIKVKELFFRHPTESKDEEEINYDAVIHLVTENDEHLYYRFDDCEHKYRLYTNGKVKSLTYDTNRQKAIMIYTDGNKVEFDYDNKIELK